MTEPVCMDLDQPGLEGFRKFLSAWLYRCGGKTFLVDPGPLSTIPVLLKALRGLESLDYILLTHIHIDHAGGVGALLDAYPSARVICHPDGVKHMIAPDKLWHGSLKVLGKVAEAYGEILPVPAGCLGFEEVLGDGAGRAFLTPGHAAHHCCYLLDDILFAGEVAGVRCEVPRGIYLRPATPPRFFLDVALDSIDRMLALRPKRMVFGHYGLVDMAMEHLRMGRSQLLLWVRGVIAVAGVEEADRERAFFAWLMERDDCYRNIDQLEPDIRARERIFLKNTLSGLSGYVERLTEKERVALARG